MSRVDFLGFIGPPRGDSGRLIPVYGEKMGSWPPCLQDQIRYQEDVKYLLSEQLFSPFSPKKSNLRASSKSQGFFLNMCPGVENVRNFSQIYIIG